MIRSDAGFLEFLGGLAAAGLMAMSALVLIFIILLIGGGERQ
jgi:hypothetical protein